MQKMMDEAPQVAERFFDMTKAIREHCSLSEKHAELVILGALVAVGGLRGLETHVRRACAAGASRADVLSSVLLTMPVVGITKANGAFEKALEVMETCEISNG